MLKYINVALAKAGAKIVLLYSIVQDLIFLQLPLTVIIKNWRIVYNALSIYYGIGYNIQHCGIIMSITVFFK